jgi:thiol:disulfide interchange protein DsbD
MRKFLFILSSCLLVFIPQRILFADPVQAAHTEVEFITDTPIAQAGRPFSIGLRITMDEGWHTYWENPGDSGLATTIDWELPEGFIAGPIDWPFPQKFDEGDLTTYGYTGEEILLTHITTPSNLQGGDYAIKGRVRWLACREICVPGKAELTLTLPIQKEPPQIDKHMESLFLQMRKRFPVSDGSGIFWRSSAQEKDQFLVLKVVSSQGKFKKLGRLTFFPKRSDLIDHSGEQRAEQIDNGYQLWIPKSTLFKESIRKIEGVLVCEQGWDGEGTLRALAVNAPLTPAEEKQN